MGIDRWKQEHRNWRPSGVRLVVSETQADELLSAAPSLDEKTPGTKPRAAKKQANSSRAESAADQIQPKRTKR